jgi:hypothetical protein
MTVRVRVFLAGDAALARGCCGRRDAVTTDLGQAAALARRRADEAGWVREQGPDGRWLDVCPWCNAALLAGVQAGPEASYPVRPAPPPGEEVAEVLIGVDAAQHVPQLQIRITTREDRPGDASGVVGPRPDRVRMQ